MEIKKQIRNLFSECELEQESNMQKMHIASLGSKVDADVPAAFVPEWCFLVSYAAETSASTRETKSANSTIKGWGIKVVIKELEQFPTCAKNAQVAAVGSQFNFNRENL